MHAIQSCLTFVKENISPIVLGAVVLVAILRWMRSRSNQRNTAVDAQKMQSIILEGDERIHVHIHHKNGEFLKFLHDDVHTVYEAFLRGMKISGNRPCLGRRSPEGGPYSWLTFKEVYQSSQFFGSGLFYHGIKPGQSTFIGAYAQNCPEWFITLLASSMYSMVLIPLYETLGSSAVTYIITQAEIGVLLVDKKERVVSLLEKADILPSMKLVVCLENVDEPLKTVASAKGIKLVHYADILKCGERNVVEPMPPSPTDLWMINYTSGTTGDPKGVITAHESLITSLSCLIYQMACGELYMGENDSLISYLPLSHLYELIAEIIMTMIGGRVGYFRGDVKLLLDDMKELKPTFFPAVPRVLNRIYDQVKEKVSGSKIKSALLQLALNSKQRDVERGILRRNTIWDYLLFRKVQNILGGRVRFITSGSAPLGKEVMKFCRCALGCTVVEGYGQSEGVSVTFQFPYETACGQVGPPVAGAQVKLIDVPEMDYYAANNQGEVVYKHPVPFLGYYKQPEMTLEAVDPDGWVKSGDIGEWLPNGCLKIIDRRKNIFKLAQGEYIAPEKMEVIYSGSRYVMQVFVEGNSFQSCVVGVVVPDPAPLNEWASNNGYPPDMSINKLCSEKALRQEILEDIVKLGNQAGLKSFEQVKSIHLEPEPFSVENGLLTPTFKNKRVCLRKYYSKQIECLYEELKT